jgi:hypothetical protein
MRAFERQVMLDANILGRLASQSVGGPISAIAHALSLEGRAAILRLPLVLRFQDFTGGTMRYALLAVLFLAGCSTSWTHPDKGGQDSAEFKREVYECAFETREFSYWRLKDMQTSCLESRGWRKKRR